MICCLQTIKQVLASFTKKRLLFLRIISTPHVILLTGPYGADSQESWWGCGVMYSHDHLSFLFPPPRSPKEEVYAGMLSHFQSFAGLAQSLVQLVSWTVFYLWSDHSPAGSWLLKLDGVLYPCPERELGRRCGVGPIRVGQDRLEGENVAIVGGWGPSQWLWLGGSPEIASSRAEGTALHWLEQGGDDGALAASQWLPSIVGENQPRPRCLLGGRHCALGALHIVSCSQVALPFPSPHCDQLVPPFGPWRTLLPFSGPPASLPHPSPSLGHSVSVTCCKKVSLTPQIRRLPLRHFAGSCPKSLIVLVKLSAYCVDYMFYFSLPCRMGILLEAGSKRLYFISGLPGHVQYYCDCPVPVD